MSANVALNDLTRTLIYPSGNNIQAIRNAPHRGKYLGSSNSMDTIYGSRVGDLLLMPTACTPAQDPACGTSQSPSTFCIVRKTYKISSPEYFSNEKTPCGGRFGTCGCVFGGWAEFVADVVSAADDEKDAPPLDLVDIRSQSDSIGTEKPVVACPSSPADGST